MLTIYSMGFFRLWHNFLDLNNIVKISRKISLSLEYFWKYYGKWSICSKRANAPFSIIFSSTVVFQRCQMALLWSKGLIWSEIKLWLNKKTMPQQYPLSLQQGISTFFSRARPSGMCIHIITIATSRILWLVHSHLSYSHTKHNTTNEL